MSFPEHIASVLDSFGVPANTKSALYELYIALGDEVLEVFSDLAEQVESPRDLQPEDTLTIRAKVVERYLRRNHPRWMAGAPTPSLWHPRELEGRASGVALPSGELSPETRRVVGERQPFPNGILMVGKNAHYAGRQETISFDVIPRDLEEAVAIGRGAGRQHTLPGSVGATSGTVDTPRGLALLWEVQPNVYKPTPERNRELGKLYRRHRNWHLITLVSAIEWLQQRRMRIFILRGEALATTHEADPANALSTGIMAHHNRTVTDAVSALGFELQPASDDDGFQLLDSDVMNHALRKHVLQHGAEGAVWRLHSNQRDTEG